MLGSIVGFVINFSLFLEISCANSVGVGVGDAVGDAVRWHWRRCAFRVRLGRVGVACDLVLFAAAVRARSAFGVYQIYVFYDFGFFVLRRER